MKVKMIIAVNFLLTAMISLLQILDDKDSYLDIENISSKLKDYTIKTN